MKSRRILRDSMKLKNSVNDEEIEKVRRLQTGSQVMVFREKEGWKLYPLAKVDGNNVNVILPSGLVSSFAIHNVRAFNENNKEKCAESETKSPTMNSLNSEQCAEKPTKSILRKESKPYGNGPASRTRSRVKFSENQAMSYKVEDSDPNAFRDSRMKELRDLHEVGCFEIFDEAEGEGHRIYRHSFVDKVKDDGLNKSRLCVAAFNDKDHGLFTAAPTVKRISIRLNLALCASFGYKLCTRDVKQALVQSKTKLRRPVYMRPPPEMRLPKRNLLKVVKTLYGMPEAPMHWFKTYGDYHRNALNMTPTAMDSCLWLPE